MPAGQLTSTKKATPVDAFIGSQIRRLRRESDISQETLGRHLGVTFQQVQKYEKGTNRVDGIRLHQIANYFGVEVGSFFPSPTEGGSGQPPTLTLSKQALELLSLFNEIPDQRTRDMVLEFARMARAKSAT